MSQFTARINAVATGGPYAYTIYKDGAGLTTVTGKTTIANALDGVKTDIGNALGGQTVTQVNMSVTSG